GEGEGEGDDEGEAAGDEGAAGDGDEGDEGNGGEAVTASGTGKEERKRLPVPARRRRPIETQEERGALTAAASVPGFEPGDQCPSMEEIATAMQARRRNWGLIPEGTSGDKVPIVRADWRHLYDENRKLGDDPYRNEMLIEKVVDPDRIKADFGKRKDKALVAS